MPNSENIVIIVIIIYLFIYLHQATRLTSEIITQEGKL